MTHIFKDINKIISIFYKKKKNELYYVVSLITLLIIIEIVSFSSLVPILSIMLNENVIFENKYISFIYNFFEFKSSKEFIVTLAPVTSIFFLISTITSIAIIYVQQKFIYNNFERLSNLVVRKYFNLSYKTISKLDSPEIIKNNLIPIISFCEGTLNAVLSFLSRLLVVLFFIVTMFIIEPRIAIFATLSIFAIYLLIFKTIKNKLKDLGQQTELSLIKKTKLLNELFIGTREIKIMNLFDLKIKEYAFYDKLFTQSKIYQFILANSPKYILELIMVNLLIIMIFLIFYFNADPKLFIPNIIIISAIMYKLLPHANQLFLSLNILKYQEKLRDIFLEVKNFKEEIEDDIKKVTFNHTLQLKNIDFSYGNQKILKNFNLVIKKNQIISIKGKSGSGKTTITNIICSLLKPDKGNLIVDNKKIYKPNKSLKEKIGFVTQNLFFFSGTLRENLVITRNDIEDEKIFQLLKMMNLYDRFNNTKEKLDFLIKFNGSNLSLGEKQRLALIRCVLMDREIIILDEPVSSLDKNNALEIKNILYSMKNYITLIIISHTDLFDNISDRIIKIDK
jgi:ABC-type bacteriocin/lantibiotic exporter with double-glycine peptidase domain